MTYKIFGEIKDEKKEKILSFRVSKKMHSYFETHAKEVYGDTSTALNEIMVQYMENITYKRGTIYNNPMFIILPKINQNIEQYYNKEGPIHDTRMNPPFNPCEKYVKIDDITQVETYSNIDNYNLHNQSSTSQEDIKSMIRAYQKNGYIVAHFYLNNYLDKFFNGIYSWDANNKNEHMGFIMFDYEDVVYNIVLKYNLADDGTLNTGKWRLISTSDAYDLAIKRDNMPLAKFIDKYNPDASNRKQNISELKNKKKELENQIKEINRQIKMLK